jgi:hypothetical protein
VSIQGVNLHLHPAPTRVERAAVAATPVQQTPPAQALAHEAERLKPLVAGRVQSGINRGQGFDELPAEGRNRQGQLASLKLYSRSADLVEAATGVTRGRILDTTA